MFAEISDDSLGDPGGEVTMAHRAESLENHQAEEQADGARHFVCVMLNGDHVPERSSQSDQGEVDESHSSHEKAGQQQARDVGTNERQESLKDHHCTSGGSVDYGIERSGQPCYTISE